VITVIEDLRVVEKILRSSGGGHDAAACAEGFRCLEVSLAPKLRPVFAGVRQGKRSGFGA
jgi:hypothetical protein